MLDESGLDRSRPIVMLNPGASFGTSKMWSAERYAALADMLVERRSAQIIINAAPAEKTHRRMGGAGDGRGPGHQLRRAGQQPGAAEGSLRRCDLLVTNDTGARHLAAAADIAVVTIFGSTDPEWARIDYPKERIVREPVECSPCQLKLCPLPAGPDYHKCLELVSPDAVFSAAAELLDEADCSVPIDTDGAGGEL